MKLKAILICSVLIAGAAAVLMPSASAACTGEEGDGATCYVDLPHCTPVGNDPIHWNIGAAGLFAVFTDGATGTADGANFDLCLTNGAVGAALGNNPLPTTPNPNGGTTPWVLPGDGETELGIGGGQYNIYKPCLQANDLTYPNDLSEPWNAMHTAGSLEVTDLLESTLGQTIVIATTGIDGPADALAQNLTSHGATYYSGNPVLDCTGDGTITNDVVNDPADCGSGISDFSTDTGATIATLVANNPSTPGGAHSICGQPASGTQPFWISAGVVFPSATPVFTVYGPTHGCTNFLEQGDVTCGGAGLSNVILGNVGLDAAGVSTEPGLLTSFVPAVPHAQVSLPTLDEISFDSS